jgi:benzoate membrane transport protein
MGLCSLVPSLILRMPVMVAWSTPGAAVLATAGLAGGFSMAEAIGAFIVSAACHPGRGDRLVRAHHEPHPHGNRFGPAGRRAGQVRHAGFLCGRDQSVLVLVMLLAYLLSRRMAPRYAVIITLLAGTAWAALRGQMQWSAVHAGLAMPVYTAPEFSLQALISLALPCSS